MKRWAVLTVVIYLLALLLLTVPFILIVLSGPHLFSIKEAVTAYREWLYWAWLLVLTGGQALLLLLPIDVARKQLPARRNLKVPVVVAGFFLGLLVLAGMISLLCAIYGDRVPGGYDLDYVLWGTEDTFLGGLLTSIITLLFFWLVWMVVFRRFAANDDADSLVRCAMRWLLRGSILELLVAVPSHIIVRRRGDCCAPIYTFWGIATGISVMLLCFGPGVFFLFVERFRRLKAKENAASQTEKLSP